MTMAFWCNGKQGFCDKIYARNKCKHFNATGGKHLRLQRYIIKAVRVVKAKEVNGDDQ